jgi:hypothetical protein
MVVLLLGFRLGGSQVLKDFFSQTEPSTGGQGTGKLFVCQTYIAPKLQAGLIEGFDQSPPHLFQKLS